MDEDQLKAWLDEGLSLPQIGELVGRDPSTVGYWVSKYGLVANGRAKYAPRGGLAREQLEPLVEEGATLRQMAEVLGRDISTIRYGLRKHGLSTKRGQRRKDVLEAVRAGRVELEMTCSRHGPTRFFIWPDGRSKCARCNAEAVAKRRRRVKEILIEEAGGECRLCGYRRHPRGLQFHHLDPATKSFGLSGKGFTRSLDKARREAAKCVLLCANCHSEVEAGIAVVPVPLRPAA
jgi:hypothetical protein